MAGVGIHPGATIGEGIFIDRGMGIVIGETTGIEEDIVLSHGATLDGVSRGTGRRYPTVKEGATISTRAQVLGPVMIDECSRIGAGTVVISGIPADATAVGVPTKVIHLNGRKVERGYD